MKKESFFKQKKVTGFFAIIAFIGGVLLRNKGITGNVITYENIPFIYEEFAFEFIPLVGTLLLACSAILVAYTFLKK